MKDYRAFVEKCAGEENPERILLNRSAGHAVVLIENIIAKAESRICIVTGCLDGKVYENQSLCAAAIKALNERTGLRINIISERPIDRTHGFLAAIESAGLSSRVEIRQSGAPVDIHFAISDGRHYRVEINPEHSFEAVAYFGNKDEGGKVEKIFDKLWSALDVTAKG
jgi:hypothetical protein